MSANHAPLQEAHREAPARLVVARPRLPSAQSLLPYLQRIDEARWYSNFGPLLSEFEQRLAGRFQPGTQVVTVTNATQALTLALCAMDLPAGGYVAMPSWTFVATAHAVIQAGLQPWLLDVDPRTGMLRPDAVMALTAAQRAEVVAVIPVCAHGAMCDLAAWKAFRAETGIPVLVDAAAAFDRLDDADLPAVVSLHATKVLGIGEGGFVATSDPALAHRIRQFTSFGFDGRRESLIPATNAKLSEYAAAIGLAALEGWPADRLRFMRSAQHLRIGLIGLPHVRFQDGWGADWVTSVCVVTLPDDSAEAIAEALSAEGVDTRQWWGTGCHASPAFTDCRREALPATERLARASLGLPFAVDLDGAGVGRIAAALDRALAARP